MEHYYSTGRVDLHLRSTFGLTCLTSRHSNNGPMTPRPDEDLSETPPSPPHPSTSRNVMPNPRTAASAQHIPPVPSASTDQTPPSPQNSGTGSPPGSPPPGGIDAYLGVFDDICVMRVPRPDVDMVRASARDGAFIQIRDVQGEDKVVVIVADHEDHWKGVTAVCEIIVLPSKSLLRFLLAIAVRFPVAAAGFTVVTIAAVGAVMLWCYLAYEPYRECISFILAQC